MKPGWVIADYIPGTGYYDRIFSGVVGPEGRLVGIGGRAFRRNRLSTQFSVVSS